ncbi:MAG: hypothetical protein ABSF70_18005 [Terracidiphilus sp.]
MLYAQADAISVNADNNRRLFFYAILATAGLGAFLYGVRADMLTANSALWLSFSRLLGVALAIHKVAKFSGVENLYLDTRAFAEALRVQYFWELSGIEEPVDSHYLVHCRTQLDWIRMALRNIWLMHEATENHLVATRDMRETLNYWVSDQADWYRSRAEKQAKRQLPHSRVRLSRIIVVG